MDVFFLSQVLLEMLFGCLLFDFLHEVQSFKLFRTEAVAAGLVIICIYIYISGSFLYASVTSCKACEVSAKDV